MVLGALGWKRVVGVGMCNCWTVKSEHRNKQVTWEMAGGEI